MLYALSGLGVNMLNLMMGSYLCSAIIASGFAEKVKPFQTFAGTDLVLSPVWAVFGIIAKIVDGVIDVPMASFADNLRSRFGRRRPAIIIGLVPMIVAYLLSVMVDKMFYGLNAGKVAWIITGNPDLVYAVIDRVSERGATIIKAQGAYRREEKHMLMVASSVKEMFRIVREVRKADPATFIVVQEAEGVHGEGFAFHSAAQEP